MRYFIGVDVGGTTTTIAIGNEKRQLVYVSDQFSTRSSESVLGSLCYSYE